MRVNQLGNTNINLSAMGLSILGFVGLGHGFGWDPQRDKESSNTIHRAVELGINWFDTAPISGWGHSEEIVGEAINGLKEKIMICTKCGMHWNEKREISFCLKRKSIQEEVELSLKRLKTDVIDLYAIHKPVPENEIQEAGEVLTDLVKQGKIRCAGVCGFTLQQLKRLNAVHTVDFIQADYNMIKPTIEEGMLDYCSANNIGVIACGPLGNGLLTGKFSQEKMKRLSELDLRRTAIKDFREPYFSLNLQLVEKLRPITQRNNKTLTQLAIAWVLRRPEITSTTLGLIGPSQVEQTIPAGDWILSQEDKSEIDKILTEYHTHMKKLKGQTQRFTS